MFDPRSRYRDAEAYTVVGPDGDEVQVVAPPPAPAETLLGLHVRRQAQRLDHLAAKYLADPAGYWHIAELADAMLAEALSEEDEIPIPARRR